MASVSGRAGAAAGSLWAQVRAQVPSGRGLSAASWGPRHAAVLALLWLHAIGLTAFALARGMGLVSVLLEGGALFVLAGFASWERVARRGRVVAAALGLCLSSAFLLHVAGGQVEARFHLFVMLGVLSLYEDWLPFAVAIGFTIVHHGIVGTLWPRNVFATADAIAHPWKYALLDAAFLLTLAVVLGGTWRVLERGRASAKDLLASTTEGILALDHRRRVTFANRSALRMSGFTEEDLLRMPVDSLLRARPEKAGPLVEGFLRRPDGKEVAVEWSDAPLAGMGETSARVITFRETAKRREAERQLESARLQLARSEKLTAVGQLVAGVAHEIRTPLTYLETNLYLIEKKADPSLRENVQSALEAADRINRLVEDLRRYSKLKVGARDPVALHDVVQEAVNLFAATHRAQLKMRTALLPTAPMHVDRVQVQQIVLNLLQNAAEAMPKGGTITVQTMMHGGNAVIAIEDEGRGIPAEIRDRIYDPFFTTKPDGTGLGLSIVKRLVEENRGSIACEERHGASGTRFEVTLPVAAPPRREVPVSGPPPAASRPPTA